MGSEDVEPVRHVNGLVEVPVYFADDGYLFVEDHKEWSKPSVEEITSISEKSVKVFNFHPIHVALNSSSFDAYESTKSSHREWKTVNKIQKQIFWNAEHAFADNSKTKIFMNLNNDQLLYYKTNGYIHLKGFLDIDYLKEIRLEAKACFCRQLTRIGYSLNKSSTEKDFEQWLYRLFNEDYDAFLGAAKLCQHTISLFRLSTNNGLINILKGVGIKQPVICVKPIIYFNSRTYF